MERLVALLLALVPWAVFPFLDLPYEPPKIALLAVIAALGCFHAGWQFIRGTVRISRPSVIDIAVCVLLLIFACSTAASVDPTASFWGSSERQTSFLYYVCAAVIYAYVRLFFDSTHWRLLLTGTAVSGIAVAAYACAQGIGIDFQVLRGTFPLYGISGPQRAFSTFGHPNFLGAYLAITLPWLAPLVRQGQRRTAWAVLGASLLSVVSVFATYSRAAWLALITAAAVFCFVRYACSRRWIISLAVVGAALCFVLMMWYPRLLPPSEQNRSPLAYRVLSVFDTSRGSVLARRNEWSFALDLIGRHPVLGYGLDTYMPFAVLRVKDVRESAPDYRGFDPSVADRIHNQTLDILWASGLLGLLAFLSLIGCLFSRLWRQQGTVWGATAAASVVAYLVSIQFGFDFSLSFPWLLLTAAGVQIPNPFVDHSVTEMAGVV